MGLGKWITSGHSFPSLLPDLGALILRVFAGLSLAFAHGISKIPPGQGFIDGVSELGFPMPTFFAWAAGFSEFLGGILVALGLATRPAAFFAGTTMAVAGFLRHAADPYGTKERALLFLAIFVFFFLAGAGRWSVDQLIRKNTNR